MYEVTRAPGPTLGQVRFCQVGGSFKVEGGEGGLYLLLLCSPFHLNENSLLSICSEKVRTLSIMFRPRSSGLRSNIASLACLNVPKVTYAEPSYT